jgi:hypothetical protein
MAKAKAKEPEVSLESVVGRAWGAYKSNYLSFIAALLLIGVLAGGLIVIGLLPLIVISIGYAASGAGVAAAFAGRIGEIMFSLLFAAVFFVAAIILSMALHGGFVAMTVEALEKGKTSVNTMFREGRKRWKSFVGAGLLAFLITLAAILILLLPGLLFILGMMTLIGMMLIVLGIIVMIPVLIYLEVSFSFIYLAVLDGNRSVQAVKASTLFGRKNFWSTFALIVFFAVMAFIAVLLNSFTYVLGSFIADFVIIPLQLLSIAALYSGPKKGAAVKLKRKK